MPPEDGGEESHRPPPDPLDRIWVHPSELGTVLRARPRRARWLSGVVTATVAGLAVGTGLLVFAGFVTDVGSPDIARSAAGSVITNEALTAAVVLVTATHPTGATRGSGVSLGDGQVVTSAQLAGEATAITVTGSDGDTHEAQVIGRDDANDLALLDTDPSLPPAPLGRSDLLPDDARVVAVAATADDRHWVRASRLRDRNALAKSTTDDALFAGLLDTDLPTTPVHAGGALVNSDGKVVGVLVAPPGTTMTGAAIPIEKVTGVCEQIRRTGNADHGWFGIVALDEPSGVRVRAVVDDGPAHTAGLRPGDVIVGIGDRAIESRAELAAIVRARRSGDVVELDVVRGGKLRPIEVTLGQLDPATRGTP